MPLLTDLRALAEPAQGPSSTAGSLIVGIIGAVLILVGLYAVFLAVRRRRGISAGSGDRDPNTGDLARRANHDLIAADDAVRDAQQELGFVEAQFMDDAVTPFKAAVDQAAGEVKAAFAIRQQLDGATAEDPFTRQRLLGEILAHTDAATRGLAAESARLQQLRDEQRHAPEVLAQLGTQADALAARLEPGKASLAGFTAYAPASWQSVHG